MNVGHKVSIEGCRYAERPDAVAHRLPDVPVEDLAQGQLPWLGAGGPGGQQGSVGEAGQHQHQHEDAQDAQGALQAHLFQQGAQEEGQGDGEDAAAGRHDAVHQTQALLEVVTQDDQTGLVGEGAAAGEHDAVGEVHDAKSSEGGTQESVCEELIQTLFSLSNILHVVGLHLIKTDFYFDGTNKLTAALWVWFDSKWVFTCTDSLSHVGISDPLLVYFIPF